MKLLNYIGLASLIFWMTGCNNEQSLQEYYVDNQGNKDFVAIDIPASMFASAESLDPEQKKTLETVKKINVLAIPNKTTNIEKIEAEKENVLNILKDEKYQLLMKFGSGTTKLEVYFTGKEEAVDEIIVYGFDDGKGMGIARLLGNDMNPGDIVNLVRSMQQGDVNIDGLSGIQQLFIDKAE